MKIPVKICRIKDTNQDKTPLKLKEVPIKEKEIKKRKKTSHYNEHNLLNSYDAIAKEYEYIAKVNKGDNIKSNFVEQGTMTDDCNDFEDLNGENKVNTFSCYETALSQPVYKVEATDVNFISDVKTVGAETEIWTNNVGTVVNSDMKICNQM